MRADRHAEITLLLRLLRALPCVALFLVAASPAAAQTGVVIGGRCQVFPDGFTCLEGAPCTTEGRTGTCETVGSAQLCVPDDSIFCCSRDLNCPSDPAMGIAGRCVTGVLADFGICLDPYADYCSSGAILPPVRPEDHSDARSFADACWQAVRDRYAALDATPSTSR